MTHSPETKAKVREMKSSGSSIRDIAKTLGIGKSTVSAILRDSRDTSGQVSESVEEEVPEEIHTPETEDMAVPRIKISELPEQDTYLKSLEPPKAAAPDLGNKAAILEFARSIRKRKEAREAREEPPEPEGEAEAEPEAVPAPVPKSKPQPMDKGTLIAKISSLVSTFAPILSSHVKDPARFIEALPSKSMGDLKTTLELLETTKNIAMGGRALFNMFGMVAGGVEKISADIFKLRSHGYQANLLSHEDELKLIFQELAYENVDSIKRVQSPTARLCFIMFSTLLQTDSKNRVAEPQTDAPPVDMSSPSAPSSAPESIEVKFSDL